LEYPFISSLLKELAMNDQPKIRVLLIDDEEALLEYMSKRLLKKGFDVKTAFSGQD